MTKRYRQSTLEQVVAILKEEGPGREVTLVDVVARAPWLRRNRVSASLALLAQPKYALLERVGKSEMGLIVFRVLPELAERDWRAQGKPRSWQVFGRSRSTDEAESSPVDVDYVDERLTEASVLAGAGAYDDAMEACRNAYYELKKGKTR